jgi:hypothetical protein
MQRNRYGRERRSMLPAVGKMSSHAQLRLSPVREKWRGDSATAGVIKTGAWV